MTRYLPPHLQELFKPRSNLEYLPPPEQHKSRGYTGISNFVNRFETPEEIEKREPIEFFEVRTLSEIRERKKKQRLAEHEAENNKKLKEWNPQACPKAIGDAYKTLFVSRLSYDVTEQMLRREFEAIGPVKSVRFVHDLEGKPRGYGFLEMERERDIRPAYDTLNGRRIHGRNILVDVERGRTVTNWKPRRFGNLTGTPRVALPPKLSQVNNAYPGGSNNISSGGGRFGQDSHRDRREDRHHGSGGHYGYEHRDRNRGGSRNDFSHNSRMRH